MSATVALDYTREVAETTAPLYDKVARVKREWEQWLFEDEKRRDHLVRIFNDTFNTDVERKYDGSHLTFPGKVGDDVIELRPHQKNFVWRALQSSTVLADHTVGAGKTFAIYHSPDGEFFATAGLCTHENVHLCDGLVMGHLIECPKHNGQFDYRTGEAMRAPVCVNLKTFPVKVEGDRVFVEVA